jgi:hypothetical protein
MEVAVVRCLVHPINGAQRQAPEVYSSERHPVFFVTVKLLLDMGGQWELGLGRFIVTSFSHWLLLLVLCMEVHHRHSTPVLGREHLQLSSTVSSGGAAGVLRGGNVFYDSLFVKPPAVERALHAVIFHSM